MTNEAIIKVLDLHSIEHHTKSGHIYAQELYTMNGTSYTDWRDVTGWHKRQLYDWLGY